MTWCRWFERRLEKLGTPGSIILSRMFAEATPYDELVKQKSLIKMLIDDMGALAQRLEQRHVQSGDTSIMPQFQIGRKINEEVKSILEEIHSGGQQALVAHYEEMLAAGLRRVTHFATTVRESHFGGKALKELSQLSPSSVHYWKCILFQRVLRKEGPSKLMRSFDADYKAGEFRSNNAKHTGPPFSGLTVNDTIKHQVLVHMFPFFEYGKFLEHIVKLLGQHDQRVFEEGTAGDSYFDTSRSH